MIITIFGATGMVGKKLVKQALAQGHTVRAFGRNISNLIDKDLHDDHFVAIKGSVFDGADVSNAVTGADAVLSVLGGSIDGLDKTRSLGMKNIIAQMQKAGVKHIIALGGMGVLNATENGLLIDAPGYPEMYKAVGLEHLAAFKSLSASTLEWSFVCAPDILDLDATQQYITKADYPPTPNRFEINAGDIADCMLAELRNNSYVYHRIGISKL